MQITFGQQPAPKETMASVLAELAQEAAAEKGVFPSGKVPSPQKGPEKDTARFERQYPAADSQAALARYKQKHVYFVENGQEFTGRALLQVFRNCLNQKSFIERHEFGIDEFDMTQHFGWDHYDAVKTALIDLRRAGFIQSKDGFFLKLTRAGKNELKIASTTGWVKN